MNNKSYKVSHEQSTYSSTFYVDALDIFYENEILRALKNISYGDGKFYLKKYGNKIYGIIFQTDDPSYVTTDFCKAHALEISCELTKLSRQYGSAEALMASKT